MKSQNGPEIRLLRPQISLCRVVIESLRNFISTFSTFLYFSRAGKCENRFPHKILGGDMIKYQEPRKTPL